MPNMVCLTDGQLYLGLCALVDGVAEYTDGWRVALFTNDIVIEPGTVLEEFDIATFAGYSDFPVPLSWFGGMEFHAPDQSRTESNEYPEFTCTGGAPQTVYGWVMFDPIASRAHFAQPLSEPRVMSPGAILRLNPFKIYVQTLH